MEFRGGGRCSTFLIVFITEICVWGRGLGYVKRP